MATGNVSSLAESASCMEAGNWLTGSGQYENVADYYARAEKSGEGFGPDDPRLAQTLVRVSGLGEGMMADDRMRPARALAIQERALGPEHLELAETLESLAMAYDWRNDGIRDAVAALRRALSIRRQPQGERHPEVAQSLTALAYLYDSRGTFEEVEAEYRIAAAIFLETIGPSDSRSRLRRGAVDGPVSRPWRIRNGGCIARARPATPPDRVLGAGQLRPLPHRDGPGVGPLASG